MARLLIPCRKCSGPACELELPKLEGFAARALATAIKLAALSQGVRPAPESQCDNPLENLEPAMIAELLAVVCTSCATPAALSA